MLHTDERFEPFTMRSFLGFLLLLLILAIPIWWMRHRSVSASQKPDLNGEWVGKATITASVAGLGLRESMHRPAVLYLKLKTYDSFLDYVDGNGILLISGETQPRSIRVIQMGELNSDGRLNGQISGNLYPDGTPQQLADPGVGRILKGSASPGMLAIQTIDDGSTVGYVFESSLSRGTRHDFELLGAQL